MEPARGDERLQAARDRSQVVSRARELSDVSFRAFLDAHDPPKVHWADLKGIECIGVGAAATLTADGEGRFEAISERADALFGEIDHEGPAETRPRLFGGFAFDADHEPLDPWADFPGARFVLPEVQLTRGHEASWLTVTRTGPETTSGAVERALDAAVERISDLPMMRASADVPGVRSTRIRPDRAEWTEEVAHAVSRIEAGELRKVVLATAMEVGLESTLDVPATLERLRRTYPNCFRFLLQPTEETSFFGPPPERLVRLEGGRVETEALAGSVGRHADPEHDDDLGRSLLESEKLQHEQRLVVDAICEQLDPFGTVREGGQDVRKLTNIQHLQTPISVDLHRETHVLEIVEALHPTPAVGGLPLDAALRTIRETEAFDRGWYAAPVGWFDATGEGEFAVAIRSAVANGTRATLYAGNGIVADSDPDEEWAEIQHKYRPILDELE
jgi:menaquinone-specific isochorismate synthase